MGVEYAGGVSGVEFGSGVLEAPSEFHGVWLVVGVGKFGGEIGYEDREHSIKVGFGEVRVGAPWQGETILIRLYDKYPSRIKLFYKKIWLFEKCVIPLRCNSSPLH